MRQSKPDKKKSRASDEEESASFKRLGGRNLKASDEEGEDQAEQEQDDAGDAEDEGDEGPDMKERADAGLKIADHLGKAASGGRLRKAYALWRVSKQLPVAAAGAGGLVKRYPAVTALIGGVATAALIYALASRAAAGEDSGAEAQDQPEGQAEDQADDQSAAEDQHEGEADEGAEEEQEAPPRRSQKRSKSRA